ncbi:cysteine protease StiP family protein [Actinoplanes sp. NBRC 101535]|uniref:cysteine protease StiP family protein n=1 Tax=Actinoplanes sp. NBRC 101535 TaxID=3032196 RepID=UPI0024A54B5E|nr:cysteine protease StiP family protein [Actinoplanes sp. NBRC 101535]GLY07705.1 hypothetical protein Acsp01_80840 [Actinoplanes sp. NBRC 101535]
MSAPVNTPLRGPAFGSYPLDDVGWLLTDLSGADLEAPAEQRERAVQSGTAHYAESLPVEYRPAGDYLALFHRALRDNSVRVAHDVGVLTELVRHLVTPRPVLLSLARAGTPVGVLMRRWALAADGADLPHYAVSIVRGRGIDVAALRWVADRHGTADLVFVDGWTGKGAIARELHEALAAVRDRDGLDVPGRLAVLADPGGCTPLHAGRDDYLIPSACLNSTVSGLVSRTVLNPALTGPGRFHGAKFYTEFAADDLSLTFLDAVSGRFDEVRATVARDWPVLAAADRDVTWQGLAEVRRIGEAYGVTDLNLVKPGIGETTRVLLRRVPWRVLVHPGAGPDIEHVRVLARRRGVPVEVVPDLRFRCVGLVRGMTG